MDFNIDTPRKQFDSHLQLKGNDRIIFSGKFGIGKTYFLDKYFKNNESFEVINLFPINYSVASNKDIFELIKHDILFELLKKDVEFENVTIPHINTFIQFASQNAHHILSPFLNFIPKMGKSIYTIKDKLELLYQKYSNFHEDQQIDEKQDAINFLKGFTENHGIYEEDFYTQLIRQLVNQIKETDSDPPKEAVLIIDDLDRIDPAHVFRILNVLAAHNDKMDDSNKFDFDRIILVCDIQNIREIFQNQYGLNVDFTGYIDKFFSRQIFDFNNTDGLSENVFGILSTVAPETILNAFDLTNPNSHIVKNVAYILTALINANYFTARVLKRVVNQKYEQRQYYLNLKADVELEVWNYELDIINIIEFLLWIFDDYDKLIDAIKLCKEFQTDHFKYKYIKGYCMYVVTFLAYEQHKFVRNKENELTYRSQKTNYLFKYIVDFNHPRKSGVSCFFSSIYNDSEDLKIPLEKVKYFELLIEAIEKCRDENVLKLTD